MEFGVASLIWRTKLTFSAGPDKVEAKLMPDGTLSGTITSQEPGVQAVRWQAVHW